MRHLVAPVSRLRRPLQERLAFAPPLKSLILQKGGAGWSGEANSVFGFQVTQVGVQGYRGTLEPVNKFVFCWWQND